MNADVWSPELATLVRPYRTFATLGAGAEPPASPLMSLVRRPLLLMVVLAAFVSFTAAGRLVAGHVGWSIVGWAFLPFLQILGLALTLVIVKPPDFSWRAFPRLVDLAYLTRAPWLVFLVALTFVLVLWGDPGASFFSIFLGGPVPIAIIVALVWSRVLEHAFWRSALGLGCWRAVLAVIVGDLVVFGPGILWYFATDQLHFLMEGS